VDRRRVVIVGASGSIGRQAREVVARSDILEVVGLAVLRDTGTLVEAVRETGVREVAVLDATARDGLPAAGIPGGVTVHAEPAALLDATQPDVVLNAAVGSAGLTWTLETAARRLDLALANKESLVAGGPVVARILRESGAKVVPVDSEHSALHQLLEFSRNVRTLTITASGGPFRGRPWAELAEVTVEAALKHPNWAMGQKNTIDSATLVNKGLEMIEARYLFEWPADDIEVAVQAQSVLHAAVTLTDGTLIATLSPPDMRRSISYALHHPDSVDIGLPPARVADLGPLAFEPVPADYPGVPLAREAMRLEDRGGTAAFNAANEVAVAAFLGGALRFTEIVEVIEAALDRLPAAPVTTVDEILALDSEVRAVAREWVGGVR
jgi:1-deoxy-D-xylulose-5-phosphate reductoisomerase